MALDSGYWETNEPEDSKWISVEDALPAPTKDVLMAFWKEDSDFNNMAVGFLREADECMSMWSAYTDGGYYTDCDESPTFWMPLPEPPDMRGGL